MSLIVKKNTQGSLELIIGCMFSGKTSELLRRLIIASEMGLNVLLISHLKDNRSDTIISTHNPLLNLKKQINIQFMSIDSLKGVRKEDFDVIGIDEAQFFDEYLIEFVKFHVDKYCKRVIVSGLDATAEREKFGFIPDLIWEVGVNKIDRYKSYCQNCKTNQVKAIFSYRIGSGEKIDIGAKDKYKPLCRKCYNESQ